MLILCLYYCVHLLVRVQFITQPNNLTVCPGDVAVFTCEVDTHGSDIVAARWQILQQGLGFVFLPFHVNMTNHMQEDKLTSRLMVTNITSDDNGTTYRYYIARHVFSYSAQLIVAGTYVCTACIIYTSA